MSKPTHEDPKTSTSDSATGGEPPTPTPPPPEPGPPSFVIEADADGKRVKLVAKDEIVLECGKASITLRRNGKVVVRGTHVETYSDGVNRIRGGNISFN